MTAITGSGSPKFDALREGLANNRAVRIELESAMLLNVGRVNPSDPGNRFIVGGAIEWLIASAAWALGVLTIPGGHSVRGFDLMDLQDAARGLWSVKAQTSKNKSPFRLTNGLGGAGKGFHVPTVFVSPNLPGLVYVDPKIHTETAGQVQVNKDATVLPFRAVLEHAERVPGCVAVLEAPHNQGQGKENPFLAYTQTIVTTERFPHLAKMFNDASSKSESLLDQIQVLNDLRAQGIITDMQFADLTKKIASD